MSKLIFQSIVAQLDENKKLLNDLTKVQSELSANFDFFGISEEEKIKSMNKVTERITNVSEIVERLEEKLKNHPPL